MWTDGRVENKQINIRLYTNAAKISFLFFFMEERAHGREGPLGAGESQRGPGEGLMTCLGPRFPTCLHPAWLSL